MNNNIQPNKNQLRFVTWGSINDGKSTLVKRLVSDVDNTAARLNLIVADAPGNELYTPEMITDASNADVAIVLCDADEGIQKQTRRHAYVLSTLGIKQIVLAVNKMDLNDYSETVFNNIVNEFREYAAQLDIDSIVAIPLSALEGDNVSSKSDATPWYEGSTLLSHLETVTVDNDTRINAPFRMPIESADSINTDTQGFSGRIVSGSVKAGDALRIAPSGKSGTIDRVLQNDADLVEAVAGQSVTLTLKGNVVLEPGDVLASTEMPISAADQFETTIVWMSEDALLPGRPYLLKLGTKTVVATITDIKHKVHVNTLSHLAAKQLESNDIAVCNISTGQQIAYDAFSDNHDMGGFTLIDRETNNTVGAGLVHFALRRSDNIHMQAVDVDKHARSTMKSQKACVVWLTGLSGSGKSTVANIIEKKLAAQGQHTYLLDGDNVRHGLNKDLGFTDADRVENIRRIGEVAKLMVDSGLIVMTAFISPFRSERGLARSLVADGEFIEVHVDTPLEIAEQRDPKGLYKKARRGELKNFTGIDSPYEAPENPEIKIDTGKHSAEEAADRVIEELRKSGLIS
ncbi:MAG: adenylyl-sulfate kinase [Granulosicoccaceae bacterium]